MLAKGPKCQEPDLKIGARVFWNQYCSPKKIVYKEKRYALLKEHDISCVIPKRVEIGVLST